MLINEEGKVAWKSVSMVENKFGKVCRETSSRLPRSTD